MLSPELLEEFNTRLLEKFGRLYDRQKYQLRWSNSCHELRFVDGNEYIGKIFLRHIKEMRMMPKYPRNQDRYVLEILTFVPDQLKHELPGIDGTGLTYEPLFFFEKKNKEGVIEYAEPNWNLVNALACVSHYPVNEVFSPEFELWKMERKEYEEFMTILDDTIPDLAVNLKQGHAAFMDSTKKLIVNPFDV